MKVKDLLRTPYSYFHVNDTLESIAKIFNDRHIASAPVVKDGEYVGMISDIQISKQLLPKKFLGVWKVGKPVPISELRKITAEKLMVPKGPFLTPNDNLKDILPKLISRKYDCLPVVESARNKKLVGIIRGSDLTRLFLRYFATYEERQLERKSEKKRVEVETSVGQILSLVDDEGVITSNNIAKQLGMTQDTVEKIGEELRKHGLISISYKFISGAVFEKIERTG